MANADNVRVIVRCRPFNQREAGLKDFCIIDIEHDLGQVAITKPVVTDMNGKVVDEKVSRTFTFDGSYGEKSTQVEVFDESAKPMIAFCMQGYNSTIFAYGQTGSGKTHTMMGYNGNWGIIPQGIQLIFDNISRADPSETYLVRCSFYEIYNEAIRDLMTDTLNLVLKETQQKGVFIEGLTEYRVNNDKEISELMEKGNKHRSVGSTNMNATSSRSHSIFQIIVECLTESGGKDHVKVGKLNLVDLAGSERAEKTGATGARLKEGAQINLSLSNLGQVIQKLVDGDGFIPYRGSKLTHILKDSLGGNAKTLMVCAISPASSNYDETMSTLMYADRAKRIKNKAKINEDPKDAQIREMKDQITRLEAQLAALGLGDTSGKPLTAAQEAAQLESINKIQDQINQFKVFKKKVVKKQLSPEEMAKAEEEKKKLEDELKEKEAKANQAKQFVEVMAGKLKEQQDALENKKKLEDDAAELERQQRQARQDLADKKHGEMMLKRQLLEAEQKKKDDEEHFANIQEELAALKRKLEKYKQKELEAVNEYQDLCKENGKELQIRQADMDDLVKLEAKFDTILSYYMPKDILTQLNTLVTYDEAGQKWNVAGVEHTGNKKRGFI